jgi:TRAP-type transport system periplasmic protein
MVPFSEMKWMRFIDVCFHHTDIHVLSTPLFNVMNLKKYNSLPPDIKKAFDEELPIYWNREAGKIWDHWEEVGKELVRKTPGQEFITLSPEEKVKWRERAMSINGAWASALEDRGLPGKKLIEEKVRTIQKYIK